MNVLIGCEESGTVRDAFIKAGHNAVSCDLKAARNGGPHYKGDIFKLINDPSLWKQFGVVGQWDLLIAHPPCTYLCVTSNKWLKDQPPRKSGALVGAERREAKEEAIDFFMQLAKVKIDHICIENPVGCMSTFWQQPTQVIQPFQFGHPEPKKTCLWLKGLPPLVPTDIVEPEYHITKSGNRIGKWYAYADKSNGQAGRAEIRSKTFPGIADAMVNQWSDIICPNEFTRFKTAKELKYKLGK